MDSSANTSALIDRLMKATNQHDLNALADCFHSDYDSMFPAHPERAFQGQEQMRRNWTTIFAAVPDLRSKLIRSASDENTFWAEWEWTGTRRDGKRFDMRGVTIQEERDGKIAWVRLFMEPVEHSTENAELEMRRALCENTTG